MGSKFLPRFLGDLFLKYAQSYAEQAVRSTVQEILAPVSEKITQLEDSFDEAIERLVETVNVNGASD